MQDLTAHSFVPVAQREVKPVDVNQLVRRFLGLIFVFVAIGLWLAPGTSETASALLLKTGLTGVLAICAIAALLPRV